MKHELSESIKKRAELYQRFVSSLNSSLTPIKKEPSLSLLAYHQSLKQAGDQSEIGRDYLRGRISLITYLELERELHLKQVA